MAQESLLAGSSVVEQSLYKGQVVGSNPTPPICGKDRDSRIQELFDHLETDLTSVILGTGFDRFRCSRHKMHGLVKIDLQKNTLEILAIDNPVVENALTRYGFVATQKYAATDTCHECEQDPCAYCQAGNPRDPSYDPRHNWQLIGEADGTQFFRCSKCGKECET